MTERWENELHKLRQVGPTDDTWQRAQRPPNGHGMPPGRERITAGVVGVLVFALVAALAWSQLRGAGSDQVPGGSVTPSVSIQPTPTPSATSEPTPTDEPSPTVAQAGDPVDLADGRYYVRITDLQAGDPPLLTFDLAYMYSGAEARQQAAAAGSSTTTGRFGDIFYVNDNPKLRTFAVDPAATVTYYQEALGTTTTTLHPIDGTLEGLIAGMNCQKVTPIGPNPMNYDFWITLHQGRIVGIEEAMDVIGDPAPDGPCAGPS
jgi:hypothetical protein